MSEIEGDSMIPRIVDANGAKFLSKKKLKRSHVLREP